MEWPIADWLSRREAAFGRLREVLNEQAEALANADDPDFLVRWAALVERWKSASEEVERVQQLIATLSDPHAAAQANEEMKAALRQLSALQQQVEDKLLIESNRNLREYQAANKQRVVLNSYNGYDRRDQVALYFDEKK